MTELKLGKLPERTPVKLSIHVPHDLHQTLTDYAAIYAQAYGHEEPLTELIPAMLRTFLEGDRAFTKSRSALRDR